MFDETNFDMLKELYSSYRLANIRFLLCMHHLIVHVCESRHFELTQTFNKINFHPFILFRICERVVLILKNTELDKI